MKIRLAVRHAAPMVISIALAGLYFLSGFGVTSMRGQNSACDIDAASTVYSRFLDNYAGTYEKRRIAVEAGTDYLRKYSGCGGNFEETVNYLKDMLPKMEARLKSEAESLVYKQGTQPEIMALLNMRLRNVVGKFRTPFKNLGSFFYTDVSVSASGNRITLTSKRATSMTAPGPYRCQTYGVVELVSQFDATDVVSFKREAAAAPEDASVILIVLNGKKGTLIKKAWSYRSYNSRNGVCSDFRPIVDQQESVGDIGIPYPKSFLGAQKYVDEYGDIVAEIPKKGTAEGEVLIDDDRNYQMIARLIHRLKVIASQ